jgi:hypothetical protein
MEFDNDYNDEDYPDESIDVSISGPAMEKMEHAAKVLEVNEISPIISLMVGVFTETIAQYGEHETYRDLAIIDPESMKAIKLCDLEELRVRAKIIEYEEQQEREED